MRLLQQTVRSSQYDKYFASRLCEGVPKDKLELLHQKDDQILGLNNQLEKLNLEKDSLQQEVKNLKRKVGELNEQLGMLMETIQAKDEVIMKLSHQLSESEDNTSSQSGAVNSSTATCINKELQELDRLKVRAMSLSWWMGESLLPVKTPLWSATLLEEITAAVFQAPPPLGLSLLGNYTWNCCVAI